MAKKIVSRKEIEALVDEWLPLFTYLSDYDGGEIDLRDLYEKTGFMDMDTARYSAFKDIEKFIAYFLERRKNASG